MEGRNARGQFTSEGSKGNQHAKGNPPNRTSFSSKVWGEKHPSWRGGVHDMKKDVIYLNVGSNKRVRRPLYVYESVYGKIPKGYVIYHIDGDMHNDDIENLEAITRAEMLERNRL